MKKSDIIVNQYNSLEKEIHNELKEKIKSSKLKSKFLNRNVIKVNSIDKFSELTIIDDNLIFIDNNGMFYNSTNLKLLELITLI